VQHRPQQVGRCELVPEDHRRVQLSTLIGSADRFGLVEGRHRAHMPDLLQPSNRLPKMSQPVAHVRSECEYGVGHRDRLIRTATSSNASPIGA
jgi:hypothetical protein